MLSGAGIAKVDPKDFVVSAGITTDPVSAVIFAIYVTAIGAALHTA